MRESSALKKELRKFLWVCMSLEGTVCEYPRKMKIGYVVLNWRIGIEIVLREGGE